MSSPKVDLVSQYAANGRYIRKATRITFPDGRAVTFMERLPKRLAIEQAAREIEREIEREARVRATGKPLSECREEIEFERSGR